MAGKKKHNKFMIQALRIMLIVQQQITFISLLSAQLELLNINHGVMYDCRNKIMFPSSLPGVTEVKEEEEEEEGSGEEAQRIDNRASDWTP